MYLRQKELFEKLDKPFIKRLMGIAEKEAYEKGAYIFSQGNPAGYVYILIKGCVKLRIGEVTQAVYDAKHPGELFGWSSILNRKSYSASAECIEHTIVRKIDKNSLLALLSEDQASALVFFKKLSEMLGNRLLHCYALTGHSTFPVSEGSGQLQEIAELE